MKEDINEKIRANPKYQQLVKTRNAYGWLMTIIMLVVYYGYIALIAFDKEFLGMRIGEGVTTIGIPIGIGVIVFTIVITGIYVHRANTEFDSVTQEIMKEVKQ